MNFSNGTVDSTTTAGRWCEPARQCGKRLGIPVYKALRERSSVASAKSSTKRSKLRNNCSRINKKQRHEMKNRHIIAAALLLLTTTAAAQDRHTETAPDTGEKPANGTECRTAPPTDRNAATAARPARKGAGHPGRKETRAAFRSRGTHRQHERNHPLDTLQTINEAVKIVIYNDNSWKYVRDREFVKDSSIYTKYWDTGTLFPYKEYPLSEMPASLHDRSGGFAQVLSLSPQGQHPLQIRHPPSPATSGSRYSD